MITNSFFAQVAMTVLAVGILFFYVQPAFSNIGKLQDSIAQYQVESAKVNEVNGKLASLVSRVNNISAEDMKSLTTYMPDEIDEVAVSRDILTISDEAGTYLVSVQYDDGVLDNDTAIEVGNFPAPVRHGFAVNVSGTYSEVKKFLSLLEKNNYPLEVYQLELIATESGIIDGAMVIVTYSHLQTKPTI